MDERIGGLVVFRSCAHVEAEECELASALAAAFEREQSVVALGSTVCVLVAVSSSVMLCGCSPSAAAA